MGGFGAVRYAQDRPDLFAYVASFSGAVDLGDSGTRAVVTEQAAQHGFNPYGPFGSPLWPTTEHGTHSIPSTAPRACTASASALYAGGGIHDADVLEGTMRRPPTASTTRSTPRECRTTTGCTGAGPSVPYGCDGGHNFSCWNFALNDAMPRIMAALRNAAAWRLRPAFANGGFESTGLAPWACQGRAASTMAPAWREPARATAGCATQPAGTTLHQTISVQPNRSYAVSAWIRTSANNADGYLGLRTPGGQVVGEQRFGRLDGYTRVSATVNTGSNSTLVVFAGLWANGDTWAQVDDVTVAPQ